jgi:hypothetical protein
MRCHESADWEMMSLVEWCTNMDVEGRNRGLDGLMQDVEFHRQNGQLLRMSILKEVVICSWWDTR